MNTLEIAIASSRPGGGESSSSPSFSSPNFYSQKMKQPILDNEVEPIIFQYFLVIILILHNKTS